MIRNTGYESKVLDIYPSGTNSTMFTECCSVAICNDQRCCPKCGREIVGYNEKTDYECGIARWRNATKHWKR